MPRIARPGLLVLLLAALAPAQDFADALPEKTAFYVSLDNVARSRERLGRSGLTAMWNDDAMRPLREAVEAAIEKASDGAANPLEFLQLAQGQMCLASIPVGQNDYVLLGMIDMKGKRREILDLVERLNKAEEGEARETEEEFRGYAITTRRVLFEGREEPETNYYAVKEDFFAVCENLDVLKDVITRRESGDETGMSRTEAYRQTMAGLGDRCDLRLYVPASLWLREGGMMAAPILAALGLERVKGVGAQFSFDENGMRMRILVHNVGEPRALMKILGGDVEGLGPPSLLPPDVDPAMAWSIDWQLIYQEALRIYGMFDANGKQELEAQIGMIEMQLGFRIHDDLLASMAPGMSYGMLPVERDESGKVPLEKLQDDEFLAKHIVFLQKLRDKDTMARILAKLTAEEGSGFKESKYLGTTVWEGTDEGDPVLAIVGDQLAVGFRPETVQAIIRRHGKDLKSYQENAAYKEAQAHVPAKRSLFVINDVRAPNGVMFWTSARAAFEAAAPGDAKGMMPGPEFLKKYLGVSVFTLSMEERGLLFNWFWSVARPEADEEK